MNKILGNIFIGIGLLSTLYSVALFVAVITLPNPITRMYEEQGIEPPVASMQSPLLLTAYIIPIISVLLNLLIIFSGYKLRKASDANKQYRIIGAVCIGLLYLFVIHPTVIAPLLRLSYN
jgi:hypothetical protein